MTSCSVDQPPVSRAERRTNLEQDLTSAFAKQPPITKPLTLNEAMARAIAFNLDHRVKQMEQAIAAGQLDVAKFDMLPRLVAGAGYNIRDSDLLSTSKDATGNSVPSTGQTSEDRRRGTAQLNLVFNVLDFGVSYARARQQSNAAMISDERRQRLIQTIIEDVRSAYWRAVSAGQLIGEIDRLMALNENALDRARKIEATGALPPLKLLDYQRLILQTMQQLLAAKRELAVAKVELGALMSLPPGTEFSVAQPVDSDVLADPKDLPTVSRIKAVALLSRPELREEDLQRRNADLEIERARIAQLPSLSVSGGFNYDTNSFLINKTWAEGAAQTSLNLIKLFAGGGEVDLAKAQMSLADARRQALSVAVMTQVEVGYYRLALLDQDFRLSSSEADINGRLASQAAGAFSVGALDELEVIRNQGNALVSKLRRDLAFAAFQGAIGRMYSAVGVDPVPPGALKDASVESLEAALRQTYGKSLTTLLKERVQDPDVRSLLTAMGDAPEAAKPIPVAATSESPAATSAVVITENTVSVVPEPKPAEMKPTEPAPAAVSPKEPEPVATPQAAEARRDRSGPLVQFAAVRSLAEAREMLPALQRKYAVLSNASLEIERNPQVADLGVFFRIVTPPLASSADASDLCGKVKSQGGQCFVRVRGSGDAAKIDILAD